MTELEALAAASPVLAGLALDKRAELEKAASPANAGIFWAEARVKLAQDPIINTWIREVWRDRDPRFHKDPEALAGFLLLRELARRPRRANALETLGLARLQFPQIEKLVPAMLPEPLQRRGHTIKEWQDFLYTLIDSPLRSYFALNVSWDDVDWLLPRGGVRRNVVGPRENRRNPSDLAWPRAAGRTNPVLLLERRLQIDGSSGEGRAEIAETLEAAWSALRPLLDHGGSEYALDLSKAQVAPVSTAWLCPVTRRVLTRLAFGATPYGHRENSPFATQPPEALRFPALPLTFPRTVADRGRLSEWLREDAEVAELRRRGVWRDLHDRAAMLADYVRAEEHSAQQPPDRLRGFEEEFKKGRINMLACSTTMEMGVDIGSVSAVMMTNVPPSIANYRQRVGRAGRRGQGFASSLRVHPRSLLGLAELSHHQAH